MTKLFIPNTLSATRLVQIWKMWNRGDSHRVRAPAGFGAKMVPTERVKFADCPVEIDDSRSGFASSDGNNNNIGYYPSEATSQYASAAGQSGGSHVEIV